VSRSFADLVALFDGLPPAGAGGGLGRFCARPLPGSPACAVGKDEQGRPALLVQADNAQPGVGVPVVLERLSVIHLAGCRVQAPGGGDEERTLSLIRCTDGDRAFQEYFLRSLHPVIASLPARPSRQQVSEAVERLIDLFRLASEAPRKTITGLWAELFVIARAPDPSALIACWHAAPEERFDFALGADRLEVKAASGGRRIHHFALEQARPRSPVRAVVASVLLDRAEGGSSAADLVGVIRPRVADPDLLIRLDGVIARTLGQDWRSLAEAHFDLQLAEASLRFIDAAAIPSVALPIPPEVHGVHFRVDLSGLVIGPPLKLLEGSRLFRSAVTA
jgi:hypothetical protein